MFRHTHINMAAHVFLNVVSPRSGTLPRRTRRDPKFDLGLTSPEFDQLWRNVAKLSPIWVKGSLRSANSGRTRPTCHRNGSRPVLSRFWWSNIGQLVLGLSERTKYGLPRNAVERMWRNIGYCWGVAWVRPNPAEFAAIGPISTRSGLASARNGPKSAKFPLVRLHVGRSRPSCSRCRPKCCATAFRKRRGMHMAQHRLLVGGGCVSPTVDRYWRHLRRYRPNLGWVQPGVPRFRPICFFLARTRPIWW